MVEFTMPQIMMTLAAIAYTQPHEAWWDVAIEGQKNPTPQDLEANLAHPGYATQGQWRLAWGPANSANFDNLMFVVQQEDTSNYALVLRGTVFDSLESWREDIATDQKRFDAYTHEQESWVANGFFDGFKPMLAATSDGPAKGQTISEFLGQEAAQTAEMTIHVTGHSQGAGLMPLFLAWLHVEQSGWPAKVSTDGFGFAPPTAGDDRFAQWVQDHANAQLFVNPFDLVPFGYAGIDQVIPEQIPTTVPELLHPVIDLAAHMARDAALRGGGSWAQAGKVLTLDGKRGDGGYMAEIARQHSHNTYLTLLGAPPTSVSTQHFKASA